MTNDVLAQTPTVEHDAVVNPHTGKPATAWQGSLLLAGSCLPVLGAVLLSPLLPSMTKDFASTPGSAALVPLVLTVPALFIAILSPFAGAIIDKLGRKRVLIVALLLYALLGTAPVWVGPLGGILATRVGVGIVEAFIMTACTTLLADYFVGRRRDKYFGLQATVTALAATAFFGIGGGARRARLAHPVLALPRQHRARPAHGGRHLADPAGAATAASARSRSCRR